MAKFMSGLFDQLEDVTRMADGGPPFDQLEDVNTVKLNLYKALVRQPVQSARFIFVRRLL